MKTESCCNDSNSLMKQLAIKEWMQLLIYIMQFMFSAIVRMRTIRSMELNEIWVNFICSFATWVNSIPNSSCLRRASNWVDLKNLLVRRENKTKDQSDRLGLGLSFVEAHLVYISSYITVLLVWVKVAWCKFFSCYIHYYHNAIKNRNQASPDYSVKNF